MNSIKNIKLMAISIVLVTMIFISPASPVDGALGSVTGNCTKNNSVVHTDQLPSWKYFPDRAEDCFSTSSWGGDTYKACDANGFCLIEYKD